MLKEKLKKNKKLVYWWRCFRNRNNTAYKNFILDYTHKTLFEVVDNVKGKDVGPLIYDITMTENRVGFFAIYRRILNALYVANRFNMIPYVSIKDTFYTEENEDFFKTYFKLKIGVDNILDEPNIIKYQEGHFFWLDDKHNINQDYNYNVNDDYINELASIKNRYLDFNSEIESKIIIQTDNLLNKEKTIGVHYRGTDYKAGFKNHPIALCPGDYFEYIDELLAKNYTKIFVATDDKLALDEFIGRYGDKVCYYKDTERSSDGKSVHEFSNNRKNDAHLKGFEVLRDMLTLSNCDAFICGKSQVSIATRVEKASRGRYEFFKLIDKGDYKKDMTQKYYNRYRK